MTYSNGQFNPNPLANPFNTRFFGNYSLRNEYTRPQQQIDPKNLAVPEPRMNYYEALASQQKKLEVPNQLETSPIGIQQIDVNAIKQRFPNSYISPDGTVFDLNSHRIVFQPNQNHAPDEWAPMKTITKDDIVGQWNDNEINSLQQKEDIQSQKYWENVKQQNQQEMTNLQKELLQQLEDGTLVKKSRLVDDIE